MLIKILLFLVGTTSTANALAAVAGGKDAGDMAGDMLGQLTSFGNLAIQVFFVIGMLMTAKGLMTLKKYNEDPRGNSIGLAITLLIVGGLLTVILGVMTIAPDSILGGA